MSNITIPLGIDSLKRIKQTVDTKGNIILDVESILLETACHKCGKLTNKRHGFGESIMVRHLSILDTPVYLRIRVVRYECLDCDDHPPPHPNTMIGWKGNLKQRKPLIAI